MPTTIPLPNLKTARDLSPRELNEIRFNDRHTPVTPALLAEMAKSLSHKKC